MPTALVFFLLDFQTFLWPCSEKLEASLRQGSATQKHDPSHYTTSIAQAEFFIDFLFNLFQRPYLFRNINILYRKECSYFSGQKRNNQVPRTVVSLCSHGQHMCPLAQFFSLTFFSISFGTTPGCKSNRASGLLTFHLIISLTGLFLGVIQILRGAHFTQV